MEVAEMGRDAGGDAAGAWNIGSPGLTGVRTGGLRRAGAPALDAAERKLLMRAASKFWSAGGVGTATGAGAGLSGTMGRYESTRCDAGASLGAFCGACGWAP